MRNRQALIVTARASMPTIAPAFHASPLQWAKLEPTTFQTLQIVKESALSEAATACLGRRGSLVRIQSPRPLSEGPFRGSLAVHSRRHVVPLPSDLPGPLPSTVGFEVAARSRVVGKPVRPYDVLPAGQTRRRSDTLNLQHEGVRARNDEGTLAASRRLSTPNQPHGPVLAVCRSDIAVGSEDRPFPVAFSRSRRRVPAAIREPQNRPVRVRARLCQRVGPWRLREASHQMR